MFWKILKGNRFRKSRLHDQKGQFVGWSKVLRHGPLALSSSLLRLALKQYQPLPWIPYTIIEHFNRFLTPNSRVLEFGSGMSTLWYAARAKEVWAVEDYRPWYDKVQAITAEQGVQNLHYLFTQDKEAYVSFGESSPEGFDLIVVDGSYRSACVQQGEKLLRPGGILYLDNTDMDVQSEGGDMRVAESYLRNLAATWQTHPVTTTDFAPGLLFVTQGMYVQRPPVNP